MHHRRDLLLGLCSVPIASAAALGKVRENPADGRDTQLLLEAVEAIAQERHLRARLLLRTLLLTYCESPILPQARLLLFYSTATTEPHLYGGGQLLEAVEGYIVELEGKANTED